MTRNIFKKKKIHMMILAACVALATAAFFFNLDKGYLEIQENEGELQIPNVVCWGDSLTEGIGGNGTNYPQVLENYIKNYLSDQLSMSRLKPLDEKKLRKEINRMKVTNNGISGESSASIAVRGGAQFVLSEEVQFGRKDKKKAIRFETPLADVVEPWHHEELKSVKVRIGNVYGKIHFNEKKYCYTFTRKGFGNVETIAPGTNIEVCGLKQYQNDIAVIFIGQNGGYKDATQLINQQKALIPEEMFDVGKYIILGIPSLTREERKDLEKELENEFGNHFINLREIMSSERVMEYVPELTEEDKAAMLLGKIPPSLHAPEDEVHFNSLGYEMIAQTVFERMIELGFYDETLKKMLTFQAE